MQIIGNKRVLEEANIFLELKTTVRGVAKILGVSKSTVHKDFIERLEEIDKKTYEKVIKQLDYNKNIRHIRGGEATKKVYLERKTKKDDTYIET